jgi:hypothetical protein
MAFVAAPEVDKIIIANDVITLPDFASAKSRLGLELELELGLGMIMMSLTLTLTLNSRLSVSFAIAQSAVLAIFEARIESKTEDYRYVHTC